MGIVYEAEQVSLGRHVALKVLPPQMLRDAKTRHRFEREARAAAKLHHTNIVPVFGVGEHEGKPYYVMQFIQGKGLDEVLVELQRLQPGKPGSSSTPVGTGGELRVGRKDVSAAAVAQSLLTGRFTLASEKEEDAQPSEGSVADNGHGPADAAGSVETSVATRLSDAFSRRRSLRGAAGDWTTAPGQGQAADVLAGGGADRRPGGRRPGLRARPGDRPP